MDPSRLAIIIAVVLMICGSFIMGQQQGQSMVAQQAAERGYVVQCLGKTGWYWECEK